MSVRFQTHIKGSVQGVGFRPHVFRLATDLGLSGWVCNTPDGVLLDVEGSESAVAELSKRIVSDQPPEARITTMESERLATAGHTGFEIRGSVGGTRRAHILPDIATCSDCLDDLFDESNRRFRYPFVNCTNCGPRFSIIKSLPYDRVRTTMAEFSMCPDCTAEYEHPLDRRFHAQPNACDQCGPHVSFHDETMVICRGDLAITSALKAIRNGAILALKGLGGYHLVVDARNGQAVQRLRDRKLREEKPLALMVPSVAFGREICTISSVEEKVLLSSAHPIVLLNTIGGQNVVDAAIIAPGMNELGLMLPYTPLHHLLIREIAGPLVATSGNRSDEPICTSTKEAAVRLADIADAFLDHNRPIERAVEDSVVRIVNNRTQYVRRSRGYAPSPVAVPRDCSNGIVLAVGGHQKNTIALGIDEQIFVSQHIGDLDNTLAEEAFRQIVHDLPDMYDVRPDRIVRDMHPDYLSSQWAAGSGLKVTSVQHHFAHAMGCLAENGITAPSLAVVFDGTGLGTDGTVWGGEFFYISADRVERAAHLKTFKLPGGDRVTREPRRSALGLLHELSPDRLSHLRSFGKDELAVLNVMLERGINAPITSSAGRLFDAIAHLVTNRPIASFEGQAAMELESIALFTDLKPYPFGITNLLPIVVDWRPMVRSLLADKRAKVAAGYMSYRFHASLARMIVQTCGVISQSLGLPSHLHVALSGGCFQNKLMSELTVAELETCGFEPVLHHHLPPNDGGLSFGQVVAVGSRSGRAAGLVVDSD